MGSQKCLPSSSSTDKIRQRMIVVLKAEGFNYNSSSVPWFDFVQGNSETNAVIVASKGEKL
jgi:hypothetical protein